MAAPDKHHNNDELNGEQPLLRLLVGAGVVEAMLSLQWGPLNPPTDGSTVQKPLVKRIRFKIRVTQLS